MTELTFKFKPEKVSQLSELERVVYDLCVILSRLDLPTDVSRDLGPTIDAWTKRVSGQ